MTPFFNLHVERTNLVSVPHTEPPPSIIAGPPMPMLASGVAMIRSEQPSSAALPAKHRPTLSDAGHDAGEPRPEGECHHVETGDHGVIGVARPAAAALGEEHDRQAESLPPLEEAVPLRCPITPGSRRGRCSRTRAPRSERAPHRPARWFTRASGDEPVGGCAAHEIVDAAASALCGDRQPPVLDEAAGITEVVEILACCPASGRVFARRPPRRGPRRESAAATDRLREVGRVLGSSGSGIR